MKNKFTKIIMTFTIIAIIAAFGILATIIYQEIAGIDVATKIEDFKTDLSSISDTLEENIKTPKIIDNPLDDLSNNSNNSNDENDVNYDSIVVNKHFYDQLDDYSKTIYKAFESNKENMKTGTYKINLGSSFTDLLSKANGQDELGKYYQSAIESYIYDNPDVFYISPNKMYLNIETTTRGDKTTYNVYINSGEEKNYLLDEFSSKEEVEEASKQVENIRKSILSKRTGNTYKDIKMVHDYLVDTIEYDTSISEGNIYNIYGALINKKCVCEGYAKALKYILDGLNIKSVLVAGKGNNSEGKTENHAWNYVELENKWYAIDSTWDDPVVIGGGNVSDSSKYRYFLKGEDEFKKDHTPSGRFTQDGKIFSYPELSTSSYK